MNPTRLALALGLVVSQMACGNGGNAAPAEAPKPTQAAAPADPDGPASIVVPDFTVSVAEADIAKGKEVFGAKGCPACHRTDSQKLVGPGLKGVTGRRSTKWIARMVLKPDVMVKQDPVAKQLLATHMVPMANQNVAPDTELPVIIAFLKSLE